MSSEESVHTIAILPVKGNKIEEFLEETRSLVKSVEENEPGTLKYYFFRSRNDQGQDQVVAIEKYANEKMSKEHAESTHLSAFVARLGDWLDGPGQVLTGRFVGGFERLEK